MMMRSRNSQGFSLIELMVVVAVIAILASIAYPSYRDYVIKARRSAASACLLEVAQFMERYNTTNLSYTGAALPALGCRTEVAAFYTFGLAVPDANSFTVTATRTAQQPDARCGDLAMNQRGTMTASSGATSGCF